MLPIQPIRAKLSIPRMPLDMVARPRLVERLNQGLSRPLTLVSAPAGYGKSTLISEWLKQLQMPCAWLTVDEGDDDLFPFLNYLVAAIRIAYPTFGPETVALLNAHTLPGIQALATTFANDLEALAGGLVLVIDDLYRLTKLPIYEFLERVIAYLPPSVYLVLSTRTDPLLSLVSLRARGSMSEVRQRELRFTPIEARTFVTQASDLAVDEATTAALTDRTDGWVVGLRLFLLSAQDEAALEKLAQGVGLADTDVTAYLLDEVMRKQTPVMQEFLLHLAIVERFSLALCEGLFPQLSWQELEQLLAQMQRQNLFVIALGEGWYRYHPLLRDLLLYRLTRQVSAAEVSDLHRRAAGWYEKQGMVSEALYHLLAAPDEVLALELFARQRMEAMNREEWQQLERWLFTFPRLLVEEEPLLAVTQAWIHHARFQLGKFMPILRRVAGQLSESQPPESQQGKGKLRLDAATQQLLEGEMQALSSQISFVYHGRYQEAVDDARRALELLPAVHSAGRAVAYNYLVYGLHHGGDQAGAQAALARALREEEGRSDTFGIRLMIVKFFVNYMAMNLAGMEEASTQMEVRAHTYSLANGAFAANYYQGILAYLRNELDVAYHHMEQVVANRNVVHVGWMASSYVFLALICQARGEAQEALNILETVEAYVRDSGHPEALSATDAARAMIALLQGRTGDALAWAAQQSVAPVLVPRDTNMREAPMVLVKTLVSDGSEENNVKAAALLPNFLETARTAHAHFLTAELLAIQAKLCLNQAHQEGALQALTEAVLLVAHVRPLRLFADLGLENSRSLIPLFEELHRRQVAPEYLPDLLAVLTKFSPLRVDNALQLSAARSSPQLVESLTARESEILALMAQGMSNREIGEQLFLSAKTVENYSLTLYGKLAVRSRGQAVARAREVGLL